MHNSTVLHISMFIFKAEMFHYYMEKKCDHRSKILSSLVIYTFVTGLLPFWNSYYCSYLLLVIEIYVALISVGDIPWMLILHNKGASNTGSRASIQRLTYTIHPNLWYLWWLPEVKRLQRFNSDSYWWQSMWITGTGVSNKSKKPWFSWTIST